MFALKARYEDGEVRWLRTPRVAGSHSLIVVFEDVDDPESGGPDEERAELSAFAMGALDRAYGPDEPDYSDAMLKAVNRDFVPEGR